MLGAGSSGLDGVPVFAAVKPGQHPRFGRSVDRGCAPAGLAWMEEPRRLSLPDHGLRSDHEAGSSRPGKARRRSCSAVNDVSTHL